MPAPEAVVLIPAYEPGPPLAALVAELSAAPRIAGVVVVNDGSSLRCEPVFGEIEGMPRVSVLTHAGNQGKGAALKTGFQYILAAYPQSSGIVTADADGQHIARDIIRVAEALRETPGHVVLGARTMNASAPLRSRFGNGFTRVIMRWVTGQTLSDTQTGLRGIPRAFIPHLLRLPSARYDFELDMLIACREKGQPIREIPISTIYLDDNRGSHFNPLRDSMRIYFVFLRFSGVALLTTVIDNTVFLISMSIWPYISLSQVLARIVAGTFQFTAARKGVFRSHAAVTPALLKYVALVFLSGAVSFLMIWGLVSFTPLGVMPSKLLAEGLLFFGNFVVQREVIFRQRARKE
jgi:putative flippase GtrA